MQYICTRRFKHPVDGKTCYRLEANHCNQVINLGRDAVVQMLKCDNGDILNLKLSKDGKVLIDNSRLKKQESNTSLSNIQAYLRYENKLKLLDYPKNSQWVKCSIRDAEDRVVLESVNVYNETIEIPQFVTDISTNLFREYKGRRLKVIHSGNQIKDISYLFKNLLISELDLQEFDTQGVVYAVRTFQNCCNLKQIDLQKADFSQVILLTGCFQMCFGLESVKLPKNISNCQQAIEMFSTCQSLKSIDLSGVDFQNLMDVNRMFEQSDLRKFTAKGIKFQRLHGMQEMFSGCRDLVECDLSSITYEQQKNIQSIKGMFQYCGRLKTVKLMKSFGKQTDLQNMFDQCGYLDEIIFPDCRDLKVRNIRHLFYQCKCLAKLSLGGLDFQYVEDAQGAFHGCSLDLCNIVQNMRLSRCTNADFMFENCRFLKKPIDFQRLDTVRVKNFYGFLKGAKIHPNQNIYFQTNSCTEMCGTFQESNIKVLDLQKFDLCNVTTINGLASECDDLEYVKLRGANMCNVKDAFGAFYNCQKLKEVITDTKQQVSKTGNLRNLEKIDWAFAFCKNLKRPDLSNYKFSKTLDIQKAFDIS